MNDKLILVLVRVAMELFNRLSRISHYIDQVEPGETRENEQLKETIHNALDRIEQILFETLGLIDQLPPAKGKQLPFQDEVLRMLYSELAKFSKWFVRLHELLIYLPRQMVLTETVQLVGGSFGDLYSRRDPTIILGSLFNAFEYDFLKIVKKQLADIQDISLDEGKRIVLQLPICDKDSPLAWSILAHEMGHAIDFDESFSQDVASKYVTDPSSSAFGLVKAWCKEICADLIAVRALGPSPALALVGLEYCVYPHRPIFLWSSTHPATKWRLAIVSDYLIPRAGGIDYLQEERDLFETAWEYSLRQFEPDELKRQKIKEENSRLFDTVMRPLANDLIQRVDNLEIPTYSLPKDSLDRGCRRLRRQSPIGAQGVERGKLKDKIVEYNVKTEGELSPAERAAEFRSLLSQFKEDAMNLPSILLCGFLRRQELLSARTRLDTDHLSRDNVETLCQELRTLDGLLANSIESSAVCSLLAKRAVV